MTDRLLRLAQRMFVGREDALARRWQQRMEGAASPERRAFLRMLDISPGPGQVVLAAVRAPGEWKWVGLPTDRAVGYHAGIAGGTGTGKTSWLLGVLAQIAREDRYPIVLFDAKGETADLLLDLLVPFLLEDGMPEERLDRLRVIKVFDDRYVPLLNATLPEVGVPKEAQAYGVASAVEQALAEPLGGRMHHVLVRLVSLCIERSLPLTTVQRWLEDTRSLLRAAQGSADGELRAYVRTGFAQENRESLRALAARLNALLFWPGARLALCAPGAVSFADALAEPGLTVVHVGNAPAGAERLSRFFGALLLGKIVRALLSRSVTSESAPALFVAEEVQECVGTEEARQIARLLSTARFRRVGVWLTGQSRSQLNAVDPGLVAAMRANLTIQVQFRTSVEDAAAFAHMLPDGEGVDRRELVDRLTHLPQRHCYLAVRDLGTAAQLVVAPRVDFESLRECGQRLPSALLERIHRGIAAIPRNDSAKPIVTEPGPRRDPEDASRALPPSAAGEFPGLG